jgi:flagella basal body P-ring formation protein FlgA
MPFLLHAVLAAATSAGAVPPASTANVAVLTRTIERGEPVSALDFSVEARPVAVARGTIGATEAAGLEASRRLMAGSVVRAADLVRPQAVHRGETVVIALRSGGLSISTSGRALSGGSVGDAVRVVSLITNHTLDGMVESSGHVRLAGQ